MECDSTDDMLHSVNKANQHLKQKPPDEGDLAIFSMDAEALFPSLHIKDILESIYDLIITSDAEFKDIDMTGITKYVKVMYTDKEIKKYNVSSCLPER